MRAWWHRHSLGTVLVVTLVVMLTATFVSGLAEYRAETADHGQPFEWAGFWTWYSFELTMSLVADVFGACLLVFGTKWWREQHSAETD